VLPVLGASTLRDAAAAPFNILAGPSAFIPGAGLAWGVTGLQLVSTRAGLLGASQLLDEIALDKYSFVRDAYLARRQNQIYDGNPPEEPEEPEPAATPASAPAAE
jgi:phospholipid-binding lipoprotein MlaA